MQKMRPRRSGKQTASAGGPQPAPGTNADIAPAGKGRPTHVRNRLIVAVAVVAAAIAGAGVPSIVAASGQLHDSQALVTLAEQTEDALTLAHSLADERDEVTAYIAAGRPKSKAPSEQRSARVDRQVEELRADTDAPASLREDLDGIAALRRSSLTGKATALESHQAYSAAITELHRLAERLAEQMPPRAGSGAYALAELDSAVQQAAAARGLLLAALSVPTTTETVIDPVTGIATTQETSSGADAKQRDALSAAAQQARLRSDAALDDFRDTAPKSARTSYDSTVTGPEVDTAERYLASLTDQSTLSGRDLATDTQRAEAALSARVDSMRGAESALYDRRTKALEQLRDDDVTALEIRIAILGALMLLAVGVATGMARSLTRPLAVLRLGSARLAGAEDPASEEPVKFTGRKDEFAQVVNSVNALHAHAVALHERIATLESDRKHLVGQRQKMADAREGLRAELSESAAQLERLRGSIGGSFVNLALRTLGLVERQLAVIEGLEEREQDPERLATLFKLDHFATVMRRHSENLLVLAGTEHVQQHAGPVPLVDVVRAAVSEIERYERVRIAALPPHAHVAGFAADDLSHLLAELMENATSFSPPDLPVEVSAWLLENGEVMLSVQDEGIGMTAERLGRLNTRLAEFDPEASYDQEGEQGLGLGLYVVARLAHRHGVRVQLREQKQGGIAAVAVLPKGLLAPAPTAAVPSDTPHHTTGHAFSLPGADAEANSNVLRGRQKNADPLVAMAERAVRETEEAEEGVRESGPSAEEAARTSSPSADEVARESGPTADEAVQESAGAEEAAPQAGRADAAIEVEPEREHPAETTMELLIPVQPTAEAPVRAAAEDSVRPTADAPVQPTAEAPVRPTTDLPVRPAGDLPVRPTGGDAVADGADGTQGPPAPGGESRTGGAGGNPYAEGGAEAEHTRTPDEEQLTDKGLPKRTPKITTPTQAPRQRTGGVDAEALRKRLGGFRQGAQAGYRDVAAEIAEQTAQNKAPDAEPAVSEEATGGTVEEASS
ncbi:nitrate- and nitrite sensing domain-containing protein [Streptomyces sp. HUAS 31]|uniref:sensor histidine kinase n=1 Tax=Streptomyces sp. HUAS 31 TaxID=3020055 RepID=UPI002306550E|nr:nitrate- and nitrite sensing domain-containing protein [Streptomyces sp. HUAS 31]WCD99437.1 nitrate- and nitrite sensing domain-containing protein [Streptomyces sp. HUAS 31]